MWSCAALGDVTGDGLREVIWGSNGNRIHATSWQGVELLDGDVIDRLGLELQKVAEPYVRTVDALHDLLLSLGDLTEEEAWARCDHTAASRARPRSWSTAPRLVRASPWPGSHSSAAARERAAIAVDIDAERREEVESDGAAHDGERQQRPPAPRRITAQHGKPWPATQQPCRRSTTGWIGSTPVPVGAGDRLRRPAMP